MVKKGKEKAPAPAPATTGSSSKKSSKTPAKAAPAPREDDFIVFTNSTKEPKRKAGQGSAGAAKPGAAESSEPPGPPKPSVKQIVGGASWTGKLPVNLLSEHCQKQKWNKPSYDNVSRTRAGPSGAGVSFFVLS